MPFVDVVVSVGTAAPPQIVSDVPKQIWVCFRRYCNVKGAGKHTIRSWCNVIAKSDYFTRGSTFPVMPLSMCPVMRNGLL